MSSTGAKNLLQGDDNGHVGRPEHKGAPVFSEYTDGWEFYGKRSFSVTTPCASPTTVDTERLAERETLLHRLGSKLNRTVFNSCGNSLSVPEKHVTFPQPGFFANRVIFTTLTIFGNTKQVIQDYDTVFDNSIPFRKNDPLRITYFRIPGVHFVPWHEAAGVCRRHGHRGGRRRV